MRAFMILALAATAMARPEAGYSHPSSSYSAFSGILTDDIAFDDRGGAIGRGGLGDTVGGVNAIGGVNAKPTPTGPFPTRPTSSFPGPRPTPSFPGPRPTLSFPGPRPTPSFPGPRPTPTYPAPRPTPTYPAPRPTPTYPEPRPTPTYPGPTRTPGTFPTPSPGTGYTRPRPIPTFPDYTGQLSGGDGNVIGPGHDHHHHEPGMPFDFNYAVKEDAFGNDYSHNAISDGEVVRGEYKVQLPDGRTQVVQYTADWQHGFNTQVSFQ